MATRSRFGSALLLSLLLALAGRADVLETRDGRILQGRYAGGTGQAVHFQVGGSLQVLPRDEVLSLSFVPDAAAPTAATPTPAAAPTAATPTPAAAPTAATPTPPPPPAATTLARIPAGTRLQVRLHEGIDARLAAVGDGFAATLETGLGVEGRPIVAAGSLLQGRVAQLRDTGPAGSRLELELTGLVHQGRALPLVTGSQTLAPAPAHPADAGPPAETRAGIPAGSLLEFRLLQPVDLRIP